MSDGIFYVVFTVVSFSAILKIVGTLNAIFWMSKNGQSYLGLVREAEPHGLNNEVIRQIYAKVGGNFFPFGAKDYKIQRTIEMLHAKNSRLSKFAAFIVKMWRNYLSRRHKIILVCLACVLVESIRGSSDTDVSSVASYACILLCFFVTIMNEIVLIEYITGTLFVEDYIKYYHMLGDGDFKNISNYVGKHGEAKARLLYSLSFLLNVFKSIFLSACVVVFFLSQKLEAFSNIKRIDFSNITFVSDNLILSSIVKCVYFVTTTLSTTGYGDIFPSGSVTYAYLEVMFLHIQTMTMFTFAAAVLWTNQGKS